MTGASRHYTYLYGKDKLVKEKQLEFLRETLDMEVKSMQTYIKKSKLKAKAERAAAKHFQTLSALRKQSQKDPLQSLLGQCFEIDYQTNVRAHKGRAKQHEAEVKDIQAILKLTEALAEQVADFIAKQETKKKYIFRIHAPISDQTIQKLFESTDSE